MSTFEELTNGTSAIAQRVMDFFTAIRVTFSPIPFTSFEEAPASSDVESQTQPLNPIPRFPSSTSQKRPSTFDSNAPSMIKKQKSLSATIPATDISQRSLLSKSQSSPDQKSNLHSVPSPLTLSANPRADVIESSERKIHATNFVVVVHLLPTLPAYLRALQQIGDIKVIIFKGAKEADRPLHMKEMAKWVEENKEFTGAVRKLTKDDLRSSRKVVDLLSDVSSNGRKEIIIMDIGGYFAPCLRELTDPSCCNDKWKLLGIVEDTENGHQKYHHALQRFLEPQNSHLKLPNIYSVARSEMKKTEDYNVGKSLVRAADSILRQSLDLRLEDHCVIGVIGFGKIGTSIAMHMRQQHIGTVMVYDVNPAIMIRALSHDFVICTKEQMLQRASFIFCATGNKSLTYNDLLAFGTDIKRVIIASCTSADDELDVHEGLKQHENNSPDPCSFSRYDLQRLNGEPIQVILLCDGNAVNFSCRAVLAESIRSVQAAMMVCALNLQQLAVRNETKPGIMTLTNEEEMTIARLWLQHFSEIDVYIITNISSAYTKFDAVPLQEAYGDLPVDQESITQLKKQLGLLRFENTDSTDFMNSIRKLIITAPRGSGKTAVLLSLIRDVRNHYDFMWWFDCNESLISTFFNLAQVFHVSSIELSTDELQEAVLKAIFSTSTINNILLIVDNVQEFDNQNFADITIYPINAGRDTTYNDDIRPRQLKCHKLLSFIGNTIADPSVRRQRRCHIVALQTEDSANQPPSLEPSLPSSSEYEKDWLCIPLQKILTTQAEEWVIEKISSGVPPNVRIKREELIRKILEKDVRRLTIRLIAVFLTSEQVKDDELAPIANAVEESSSVGTRDVLLPLIELSLGKLKQNYEPFFIYAQVASLIHAGSITHEVFHRLYDMLSKQETNTTGLFPFVENRWKVFWQHLLSTLKEHCILKQNILAPNIHTHANRRHSSFDYVEVYSMPSTYVKALNTPLLKNTALPVWKYTIELIRKGFNYDYYDNDKRLDEHNVVHYFDHTTAIIRHTNDWNGKEPYAAQLAELLCSLGSYYLNERRMYSEASKLYGKASSILFEILNPDRIENESELKTSSLEITKWSATLMRYICEQLSDDPHLKKAIEFIAEINKARYQLYRTSVQMSQEEKKLSRRYQLEAIISVARIRVQQTRDENISEKDRKGFLEDTVQKLEEIQNEESMGTRTRSLLLQILGSAYSLLKEHTKALECINQALTMRKRILPLEHLDVARTSYRFASCLVEEIVMKINEGQRTEDAEIRRKLDEAKSLLETAFKIQKTQLSSTHINLIDCNNLRRRIDELFDSLNSPKTGN